MRDLLQDPAWREEDLGLPLPESPHACAVCLPTWDSVIGYEEGREQVLGKLRAGYPRFFLNPATDGLFTRAEQSVGRPGERVVVFPNRNACQRAQRYVERKLSVATRIASFEGLQALAVPEEAYGAARDYWKHTGEIVSSRQAADVLDGELCERGSADLVPRIAQALELPADGLFLYESGMAAIYSSHRIVTRRSPGRKTLQLEFPYVDALKVQEQFGSGVVFLPHGTGEGLAEALQRIRAGEFAGVFCELPSNPLLHSVDLAALAAACRISSTPLVVDDTVASHRNVDVFPHADIATSSLTKWASGEGDVMAGAARVNPASPLAGELHDLLADEAPGQSRLYRKDAEVLLRNAAGFADLVERSNRGAEVVADFLQEHPAVEQVWYPKFIDRERYESVLRPGGGYGGLISLVLKNDKRTPTVYDSLRWSKGPSLGTRFSLACTYSLLAHYTELDWAESCGVRPDLLRLSVGVEDPAVLCDSLGEALAKA